MEDNCPFCKDKQAGAGEDKCEYLMVAYVFAGLAMMLNIRLSYSSAPYALIRFMLPENLFSVFVRRMASALELWCLPSMLLGNIVEYALKGYYKSQGYTSDGDYGTYNGNLIKPSTITISGANSSKTINITNLPHINDPNLKQARQDKFYWIICPSIATQWLNFLTYVILLFVYLMGGDQGRLTTFYWVIAISGFVFGINMVLLYAVDWNYIPVYMVGENSFPIVTSAMHYVTSLIFGNRRKYNSDFLIVVIDISVAIIISFVAAVLWTWSYGFFRNTQKTAITGYPQNITNVTIKTKCTDDATTLNSTTANINNPTQPNATLNISSINDADSALQNTPTGTVTHANVKVDTASKTLTINYTGKCIEITLTSANTITTAPTTVEYGHILTESFDMSKVHPAVVSPTLMVIVGMGLVYAIYPGIAPGMIVPFYLIDKIEMVLLIATFFPPVIVALLNRGVIADKKYSPKSAHTFGPDGFKGWMPGSDASFYHAFDILLVIKISLAVIFICCLHYRDSSLSRSIVNQPKMSTTLSIIFYMCHECLLALGFPGVIGNNGSTYVMLPAQYVGALFMIFLAFYSEGYIIEYKSHDPAHWPTEGMTKWNAFCYWCKRPSKITNQNPTSWFRLISEIFTWLPYTLLYCTYLKTNNIQSNKFRLIYLNNILIYVNIMIYTFPMNI